LRAGNIKIFYATAEKILRLKNVIPVVRFVIVDN
jgi:hypothetical protein